MGEVVCEVPKSNPDDGLVKALLEEVKTIAIVGLSPKEERDSNKVARYMMDHGYTIIPVNPVEDEILGQKSYPDLASIPDDMTIDVVDVFRKIDVVPAVVEEAMKLKPRAIWLQLGLAYNAAIPAAQEAGIQYIQARCIKVEHHKLLG